MLREIVRELVQGGGVAAYPFEHFFSNDPQSFHRIAVALLATVRIREVIQGIVERIADTLPFVEIELALSVRDIRLDLAAIGER